MHPKIKILLEYLTLFENVEQASSTIGWLCSDIVCDLERNPDELSEADLVAIRKIKDEMPYYFE